MYTLIQDLRFAFRQLMKAPGFGGTVVLTLALGIGGVTAMFSLIEGILLRPLPFREPDRLVLLGDRIGNSPNKPVTAREIGAHSNATSAFSSLGGYINTFYEVSGGATPEQISGARFTAGVFPTLGVPPILGRVFTQQEEDAHQPLAVISYALWLNRYHRDPLVYATGVLIMMLMALVASLIPATRTASADPVDALRAT
jgi:hypothetical protein